MQTNNSWEDPVVTKVNSLQDLGKLVQAAPEPEKHEPKVYKVTRGNRNPQLQAAMAYAEAHPEELIKDVAAKFNVSKQSLYSLRYDMRNQQGADVAERKCTREESLARAYAVRKAKAAENKVKRELEKEVRKKLKAEAKQSWKHAVVTTSPLPLTVGKQDVVNHPAHYKTGGIETIDFIEAKQLTYNLGNVVKYITRAGIKNKATHIEDLEKAAWYLNREIANLKK